MAHIPEETIARIKRETSFRRLVEGEGLELVRHGTAGDVATRCVYHEGDDEPSLVFTESNATFHCFGCGAAGNVIQWVMRRRGLGFREAAFVLLEEVDGAAVRVACPLSVEMSDREIGLGVVDFYHEELVAGGEGREYLARRGVDDEATIRAHRLGVSSRRLGRLIPEKNRVAGGELRRRLQQLGLWRASGHEHAAGSVVIPIFDEEGGLGELYARKIHDNLRPGTPRHLYLPGPHRGVWNREALTEYDEVLVCEGGFDALTFWRWGLRNVTWVYGVEGLTAELVEALAASVARVLLSYDGDTAGDRGVERHAERLMAAGLECFRVPLPRGQDVNSLALSVADPADALASLVRQARWLGRGARPAVAVPGASVEKTAPSGTDAAAPFAADLLPVDPEPSVTAVREPAASPVPAPPVEVGVEVEDEQVWITIEDRRYRARWVDRTPNPAALRVSLMATRGGEMHVDTLDLAMAKARRDFAAEASVELGVSKEVVKRELGRVFFELERVRDERLRAAEAPKATEVTMTDEEREEALAFWRAPGVLSRVLEDFDRCGVVGERTNKLVGYLVAVSRKLDDPLAIIVQSSSAAGKTSLMEAILAFVPDEERVKYSAMTGQSLFYMGDVDLKHKVLALVEEEGVERASYALKLLQSEGELSIASTGKDPQTGRLVTHEYAVEGPVALMLTTTAVEVNEELQNRCIVLTVDEDREQTRAIHRQQRERWTLEGLVARRHRERIVRVHRNAQRLLRPVAIINPWARRLTFLDDKTRTRRDHEKYLTLIAVIAFVHQYQRPVKTMIDEGEEVRYVEVTLEDIAVANRLATEVLGRSLDELAPKTRRLLAELDRMATAAADEMRMSRREYRFSQREVREATGWSATQVKVHLGRLVELEYVIPHRGGRGQQIVYELVYEGQGADGQRFVMGLIDVEKLVAAEGYDGERSGSEAGWSEENGGWSEGGPPVVLPWSEGGPIGEACESPNEIGVDLDTDAAGAENALIDDEMLSYLYGNRSRGRGGR